MSFGCLVSVLMLSSFCFISTNLAFHQTVDTCQTTEELTSTQHLPPLLRATACRVDLGTMVGLPQQQNPQSLLVGWGGTGSQNDNNQKEANESDNRVRTGNKETKNDREGKIVTMMGLTR
jgi:hypothetical protein